MDSRRNLKVVFLILHFVQNFHDSLEACDLPLTLRRQFLWDWTVIQGTTQRASRVLDINSMGFERNINAKDRQIQDLQVTCNSQKDEWKGNYNFTVFSGTDQANVSRRICVEGTAQDTMLLWRQTPPQSRATPYTANECARTVYDTVNPLPAVWRYLRKFPLSIDKGRCPFPRGRYQTEYSANPAETNQCQNDATSITTLEGTNLLKLDSCSPTLSTYDRPFKGNLFCVDDWPAEMLGARKVDGDFIVLSYMDLLNSAISFYCGRYRIDNMRGEIHISLYKVNRYYAECEADRDASYVSDKHVALVLKSTLCEDEKPCKNGGSCVDRLADYSCICPHGYTGKDCGTEINYCDFNPCKNGGRCNAWLGGFDCTCTDGWEGDTCEDKDHCAGAPCLNGGTCSEKPDNSGFLCSCNSRFTGSTCGVSCNCQNEGICMKNAESFTCNCPVGFTGTNCESVFNPCSPNPCLQGGTCIRYGNDFGCNCVAGFKGKRCEQRDPCTPSPCLNGGTCRAYQDGEWTCICPAVYGGEKCEEKLDACGRSPCQNGATCSPSDSDPFYTCQCPQGFNGSTCAQPIAAKAQQEGRFEMYRVVAVIVGLLGAAFLGVVCVAVVACWARRMRKKEEKYSDRLSEVRTLTKGSTRNSYVSSVGSERGSTWYPSYLNGTVSSNQNLAT